MRICLSVLAFVAATMGTSPILAAKSNQAAADCVYPYWRQNPEKAIAGCTEYLTETLDDFIRSSTLHRRGEAYDALKDYRRALVDYDLALALLEKIPDTLAGFLKSGGKFTADDFAGARFSRASILTDRGMTLHRINELDRAIADQTKVIEYEVEGLSSVAYRRRGMSYLKKKDYLHALADFDRRLSQAGGDDETLFYRGQVHVALGNYDKAIADLTEAIEINSGNPQYGDYNVRGLAYYSKKMYREALSDFEKALSLAPDNDAVKKNLEAVRRALTSK